MNHRIMDEMPDRQCIMAEDGVAFDGISLYCAHGATIEAMDEDT